MYSCRVARRPPSSATEYLWYNSSDVTFAASGGKCVESELNIGDYIPYFAWMDLQGLNRRLKNIHKTQEKRVEEHFSQNKPNVVPDLLDVLLAASADENLGLQITRDNIKSVVYVYYLLAHTRIYRFSMALHEI